MKIGIFSDVHSNLPALKAVLGFLEGKVEKYVCCGDVIGYGPHPNRCIEMIQELKNISLVCGNHDRGGIGIKDIKEFSENAAAAIKWTMGKLTDSSRSFLGCLHPKITMDNFTVVHGSLIDPVNEYVVGVSDYMPSLMVQEKRIVFNGHTHRPLYFRAVEGVVSSGVFNPGSPVKISDDSKYLINVGSVGQPRDADPRAACAIYDTAAETVMLYRLEYDIKTVQDDMTASGLPRFLIARLGTGV